jgi:hypothetical protein
MIAVLTTVIAPPHLFDDVLETEIDIPSGADRPLDRRKAFVKYFDRLPRLCRELHPISPLTVRHFQTQLRGSHHFCLSSVSVSLISLAETGFVDKFHFFLAMMLETVQARPDIQLNALLEVPAVSPLLSPMTGF